MSSSINTNAIDAVTEGINRIGILDSEIQICANCGKEGSDVTNTCNKCKSVMYCNAACKKKHRKKHKKECEENVKRAAEHAAKVHDEKLFKQPPPNEDCPICMIRLPTLLGRTYMACCGKVICTGCVYAFQSRAFKARKDQLCPFCRTPPPNSNEEEIERLEKRIELNDAYAIYQLGIYYAGGKYELPRDVAKALELWHRAGELGCSDAYYNIAHSYNGNGMERNMKKAQHYWELAAIGGSIEARNNLGVREGQATYMNLGAMEAQLGNFEKAVKHFMIATKDGDTKSLKNIKAFYSQLGLATKDDYAKALQSYKAYVDEIKTDQRDEAAAYDDNNKYY